MKQTYSDLSRYSLVNHMNVDLAKYYHTNNSFNMSPKMDQIRKKRTDSKDAI